MKYKILVLGIFILFISCGNDDSGGDTIEDPEVKLTKLVDKKVFTNRDGVKNEIRFTYNEKNNLVRIDSDTYYKTYTYNGENITKIESIDFPDSPYYTIEFMYDTTGSITHTKRTNHYDNTIMIVEYFYSNNLVVECFIYESEELFNVGSYRRRYDIRYEAGSRNFEEKDFYLRFTNFEEPLLETSKWLYDSNKKPYFGEAIERVNLPYATSGIELDYEYVYNTNNPLRKDIVKNTGESGLSKTFEYSYDDEGYPKNMIINQYSRDTGELLSKIQNDFVYIKR